MGEGASVFQRLAAFASQRTAVVVMAIWGAAEAIALPVVPDVGLGLLVLAAPVRSARLFGAVVAGAVAGTLVLASWVTMAPDAVRAILLALPGIDGSVVAEAGGQLARDGVLGFAQVGPGPPLKVYATEWVGLGGDVPGLVVGAILNRLSRIGSVLVVAAAVGWLLRSWLRSHESVAIATYAGLWVAVYVVLWA